MTKQCYFYDLNSQNTSKSWNGELKMNLTRERPLLVALKEKVNQNKILLLFYFFVAKMDVYSNMVYF